MKYLNDPNSATHVSNLPLFNDKTPFKAAF